MMNPTVWKQGVEAEVHFWKQWLSGNRKKYESQNPLNEKLVPFVKGKSKVKIADIGSGPVCLIGSYLEGMDIKVIPSDILADKYKILLEELDIKPFLNVEKQDMTKLTYEPESFDIVYCSNAIDHSPDPYEAIKEMVRICKPGGWIYLFHIAHEGQRNRYRNLHQWNFDMTEDEDCIVWNNKPGPKTDTFLLSEVYPNFKTSLKLTRKAGLVTSVVQKHE